MLAWQAPRLLDWGGYRGRIAAFASTRLGRSIVIRGPIHFQLLPDPVLSADQIVIADRGDGMSATIAALRLRLAVWPLLGGHVVPRELLLERPVLRAPWPVPGAAILEASSSIPRGFFAGVEHGSVVLGGVPVSDIAGSLRRDPDTGAFMASGEVRAAGRRWRTTGLLDIPGPDGAAPLSLAFDGSRGSTGASFRGRVMADGTLAGSLEARGSSLAELVPAPALAWRVQGPVRATARRLDAQRLQIMLGTSPGMATLALRLAPMAVSGSLAVGQADLGAWARAWRAALPSVPVKLDLHVAAAALPRLTLHDLDVSMASGGGPIEWTVRHAGLPDGGTLQMQGKSVAGDFAGRFALHAPDLQALAQGLGLRPVPGPASTLDATGAVAANEAGLEIRQMAGQLDGSPLSGDVVVHLRPRPSLRLGLHLQRLDLDSALASLPGGLPAFPFEIDLTADQPTWHDRELSGLQLQADFDTGGVNIRRLQAGISGAHATAAGRIDRRGAVTDGRIELQAPDAAPLRAWLPPAWRPAAALFHGALSAALTASGPPDAIGAAIRADLGDLRFEAETRIDAPARTAAATLTLRHPGAPRLLTALGAPDAARTIGAGSFALVAQLLLGSGHVTVPEFRLGAGGLHLAGKLAADLDGPEPAISANLSADPLTLPDPQALVPAILRGVGLGGWSGTARIEAPTIWIGGRDAAAAAEARIVVAGRAAAIDALRLRAGGFRAEGEAALDASADPPRAALRGRITGLAIDHRLTGLPIDLGRASLDVDADLSAAGSSGGALLATLTGPVAGRIGNATVQGVNMARLDTAMQRRGPLSRTLLRAALTGGSTPGLDGSFDAVIDRGDVSLNGFSLAGPGGSLSASGSFDLAGSLADLRLVATPDPPTGLLPTVRLLGPVARPRRLIGLQLTALPAAAH